MDWIRNPTPMMHTAIAFLLSLFVVTVTQAQGFKFSNEDQAEKAEKAREADRQVGVQWLLATPCKDRIKNQKIMVLIGEERNGLVYASQLSYDPHFNAINDRLKAAGLRPYTREEIYRQITQAVIEAYLRNDTAGALNAAKRLAAQYILRGVIATQAGRNRIVNVNQVSVSMDFTLTDTDGRLISQASATNESFAGRDTTQMALTLINEKADEVVAKLYSDYCQKADAR
jgi:hypothetical protein